MVESAATLYAGLIAGVLALLFVVYLALSVLRMDKGTERMVEIASMVQAGARAFLSREYRYVAVFVIVIALGIGIAGATKPELALGWGTSIAFVLGAIMSALAGFIGMTMATRAAGPTAQAASTSGVGGALRVAVSGGAVMGMSVVGLALIGLAAVCWIFDWKPAIVNGYAMGASLVALFARSGGGIFTKGADMGADLVGKVEAGIPEDDPRNPAVIADNVGDNVGDVAGLGADLLESYVESMVASMAIAAAMTAVIGSGAADKLMGMPMWIAAVGIVASIIGVLFVRVIGKSNAQASLMAGTYVAAGLAIIGTFFIVKTFGVAPEGKGVYGAFWATVVGILSGVIVGFTSEFFTSSKFKPVRALAEKAETGPAVTVVEGIAVGMQSTGLPVVVLAVAVVIAYHVAGIYGIALAALGMLATTGMIVSVDSYGPIADNAGGMAEMAEMKPEVRKITDNLDAVGNTTAAIGKGFAIGSAAFAAIGLISAFMATTGVTVVDLKEPGVLAGLLIGAMLPYLFSSYLFRAVGRCAFEVIKEVRRQFKEIPGLLEGNAKPDPVTCVDIATRSAIQGMLLPGVMAIAVPVIVGFALGAQGLAGLLVGSLACGLMLGIQCANSGGALDNAKKYIEEGHLGGKGSDAHKAAVVGDTVGDPLKDTVGPSINILIKLMAVISLVLAPLFAVR